jgi:O-6-methylguanine DNA methyltransferase
MIDFKKKVFDVVRRIPKGRVLTYAQVAKKAGSPRAFRAVGSMLKKNFDPAIPCHRVVRSDGTLGNYNRGGSKQKRCILLREGVLSFNTRKVGRPSHTDWVM